LILQLEAYNYRCLKVVRQPLRRFHILIGRNGSGKSAFLDALMFLRDAVWVDVETAVFGTEDIGVDWFLPRTHKDFRDLLHKGEGRSFTLALVAALPHKVRKHEKLQPYDRCRYQVRIGVDEDGDLAVLDERLWLIEEGSPHDLSTSRGFVELESESLQDWLFQAERKRFATPKGWRKVIVRRESKANLFSETTKWNFPQTLSPYRPALSSTYDETRFPAASWLRDLLIGSVKLLQLNPRLMRKPCAATSGDDFSPDGSNLPKVVKRLKEKNPQRFRRWLEHVRSVLNDLQEIEVERREEDNALYLVLNYGGVRVKQWNASEGTLRFLALTLLGYLPDEECVWLIEEPENGIHPQALEAVVEALATANNLQILMATHSPVVLDFKDYIKPSNLLCFRLEDGATVISTAEDLMREWRVQPPAALTLGDLMAWGVL